MRIVIAGGSGFIGSKLVDRLVAQGEDVAVLSRDPRRVERGRGVEWRPGTADAWTDEVAEADAVINLAGENIGAGRWTTARKERLVRSRLDATGGLVSALAKNRREPAFVSASAIGFYGDRGDEILDESSAGGSGFLADLSARWENAARGAESKARLVILRFGIVLAADGGALAKMAMPFRFGAGGPIGSGNQWMSWIDRDDVVRMIEWAIREPSARGVYNATAPEPVRNRDFAKTLGRVLRRPALLPTPALPLRLLFGEMADEALLGGQRVIPARATAAGFRFEHTSVESSLMSTL